MAFKNHLNYFIFELVANVCRSRLISDMMSKRSIKDISADQEKLVANVLVDLLGRDHKALKVEKSDLTSVETESHKMDMLSSDEAIIGFSKPNNIVRLREFLVEWTGP